jgi:multiple sugar transport system permease protein
MRRLVRHAVLASASLLVLAPFLWMLAASVMPHQEIMVGGLRVLPEAFAFRENYGRVIADVPIPRYLMNGILVCAAIFVLQVVVAVPAAYALAKLQFRGRDLAMAAVLLGLMVPAHVPAIPVYVAFYKLGLINTYAALILPHVASVFGIFLLRQFFRRIPDETLQAARLDGLSELEIVWRIAVPFALPAIIAFGLFSFVVHWNDLFWPLIVANREDLAMPPLGILMFHNEEQGSDYGAMMAAAVLMTLPLAAASIALQRRFMEGISLTATYKGEQR